MMNQTLSAYDRARAYVDSIPGAISGNEGHNQTFSVAMVLVHGFALSEGEALALLREYNQRCQPTWSEKEMVHKIHSAISTPCSKSRGYLLESFPNTGLSRAKATPLKAHLDPVTAAENYLKGFRCLEVDLWEASPIRPPEDWTQDGACLAQALYHPGDIINVMLEFRIDKEGKAHPMGTGISLDRDEMIIRMSQGILSSDAGGWLRMNPTDGRGIGDENVTAFRFALIEWDKMPLELQLSLLAKLPLPIAAIMTSGARSIHAWIKVDAADQEQYQKIVERMIALLARLGLDRKNKNPSRLSRLPGVVRIIGARGNGRQRLLYINPNPEQKAIL